jgi:hypothetical protein
MLADYGVQIDGERKLWLMEISRQTFEDHRLTDLESDHGLFLILEHGRSMEILAKAASPSAGRSMLSLFANQLRQP